MTRDVTGEKLLTTANLQIVLYTLASLADASGTTSQTRRAIIRHGAPEDGADVDRFILDTTTGVALTSHNLGRVFIPALEYLGAISNVRFGDRLTMTIVRRKLTEAECEALRRRLNLRLGPMHTSTQLHALLKTA